VGSTAAEGDPDRAPHVVNNSWACPPSEGCDPDTLEAAVTAMRQAGILVVVSAGNEGSACGSVIHPPAIYRQAFSVGAFSHVTGRIASFSSRGPASYGGESYLKPEIVAPGVGIRSSVPGDEYGSNRGTSMAAPHVAGAAALLLSAAPGLRDQVAAIQQVLISTAGPRLDSQCGEPGPPNNVWGWGVLDALAAVETVTAGTLRGAVRDGRSGEPVAGARVTARLWAERAEGRSAADVTQPVAGLSFIAPEVGAETQTGPTGWYTMTLPAASFVVTATAGGHFAQVITGVTVISGTATVVDFELPPAFGMYLPLVLSEFPEPDHSLP
jgi:subtilisin family serine protease